VAIGKSVRTISGSLRSRMGCGLALVTRNIKHFGRIEGLRIEIFES
jgi:hypothetical protein